MSVQKKKPVKRTLSLAKNEKVVHNIRGVEKHEADEIPGKVIDGNQEIMTNPQIYLRLDGRGNRQYFPGETLAGSYFLNEIRNDQIEAVEISVLWYTEGKGSSDFGIHAFWRRSNMAGDWIDPRQPGRFSTTLPNSPLSYLGVLIRIHWSVRIRVFLENGEQMVEELRFRLGDLPDVRTLRLEQSGMSPVKGGKA